MGVLQERAPKSGPETGSSVAAVWPSNWDSLAARIEPALAAGRRSGRRKPKGRSARPQRIRVVALVALCSLSVAQSVLKPNRELGSLAVRESARLAGIDRDVGELSDPPRPLQVLRALGALSLIGISDRVVEAARFNHSGGRPVRRNRIDPGAPTCPPALQNTMSVLTGHHVRHHSPHRA